MRILLVSHPPLSPELGASQIVLNLAAALSSRGHEVVTWTSSPLPAGTRWWNAWRVQRRLLERFLATAGSFDAIDVPAISATARVAAAGPVVARSAQPDFLYLDLDLAELRRSRPLPRLHLGARLVHAWAFRRGTLAGWKRSRRILCLGSLEEQWMRRQYPQWEGKLGHYLCAPGPVDQASLAVVRRERRPAATGEGLRFLWLGRWSAHKGTARLVELLRARAKTHPRDRFTLAGCGPAAAEDCPRELVEAGVIRILPDFRRSELPGLLARHDAGLFTSEVEGWGLSLNEMLEAGLTVFATSTGAVPDLEPFFPERLLPFPPPAETRLATPTNDLDERGYFRRFTWAAIGERYEREVLNLLAER